MSRHRGRDAPPATQRARAAPGAHARPRRGPALGRGRQRAGSGRRARRAARSREPCSRTDPRVAIAAGTLGTGCGGRQREPRPRDPPFCKLCADARRPRGSGWERLGLPDLSWRGGQHAPATSAACPWKHLAFCDAKYST